MTDRELKKLSRAELLEMLVAQMKENEALSQRLQAAEAALESRRIEVEQSGTMAEAALRLNGRLTCFSHCVSILCENTSNYCKKRRIARCTV